jgi:hypothetical protein
MNRQQGGNRRELSLSFVCIVAMLSMVLVAVAHNQSAGKPRSRQPIAIRNLTLHRPGISIDVDLVEVVMKSVRHRGEVNRRFARLAHAMFDEYVGWYTSYWEELGGYSRDETPLYSTVVVDAFHISDNLVSVRFAIDLYSGGAHPNGTFESLTLDLSGDTVREVKFSELFSGGATVDTVLADEAVAQVLHEQEGVNPEENLLWGRDELRQSLIDYGFSSFVIDTAGILLARWPGPHVIGPIYVTIPYETLDPFIPAGGVLDLFLTRRKNRQLK